MVSSLALILALLGSANAATIELQFANGDSATGKTDPDVNSGCTYWANSIESTDTCAALEDYFGITTAQLVSWNPSLSTTDCTLNKGWSYFVEAPAIKPTTTKKTTTTTTTKATTTTSTTLKPTTTTTTTTKPGVHPLPSQAHRAPVYECETCEKEFDSIDAANQHMDAKSHRAPEYNCETCEKGFDSINAANQHMQDKSHFKNHCPTCDRHFTSEDDLRMVRYVDAWNPPPPLPMPPTRYRY
ncbi:uncharacterized protein KD926_003602 [Aspergillus affinis]|uniref:uncharacterized protein n=1 Tax=Aspergillus affinis TaxID=1070780 RepID=UPI0022FEF3EB|nr:uncharacterized protein KD926_003602 [Aspergillus affinis]KAI9043451.1 hypothetical protein KD926_003602 [Aspergillus affinis]